MTSAVEKSRSRKQIAFAPGKKKSPQTQQGDRKHRRGGNHPEYSPGVRRKLWPYKVAPPCPQEGQQQLQMSITGGCPRQPRLRVQGLTVECTRICGGGWNAWYGRRHHQHANLLFVNPAQSTMFYCCPRCVNKVGLIKGRWLRRRGLLV